MKENDNIDLGSWSCPTSWEGVTLKMYSDIERYYSDKDKKFDVREVLHILCDKSVDEVNALPISFTEKLLEGLMFLQEKPKDAEPSCKITIDGEVYVINIMEKLKTGEYIAIDSLLKNDSFDYSSFLAIICRKEGEVYDSKFEAEMFEKRREMFSSQSVVKILPLISFFLNLYMVLRMPTQLSLEVREGLNLIRENIKSSRESGDLSALSTRLLMRRLKKLEKLASSI